MDINQKIKAAIANLKGLLENANDLGELKSLLKEEYPKFATAFVSQWNQCDLMTKLDSYNALTVKINAILNDTRKWFYIGYTGKLSSYLWTTEPENQDFETLSGLNQGLVKRHTYYIDLNENRAEETEHNLINKFYSHEKCLNRSKTGDKTATGIVYVLVYEPQPAPAAAQP